MTSSIVHSPNSHDYGVLKEDVMLLIQRLRGVDESLIKIKQGLDQLQIPLSPMEDETEIEFLMRAAEYLNEREYAALRREESRRIAELRPIEDDMPRPNMVARGLNWLASKIEKVG